MLVCWHVSTRNGLGIFLGCQVILLQIIISLFALLKKNTSFSYKLLLCLFSEICYMVLGCCCFHFLEKFYLVLFTSANNVFGNTVVFHAYGERECSVSTPQSNQNLNTE